MLSEFIQKEYSFPKGNTGTWGLHSKTLVKSTYFGCHPTPNWNQRLGIQGRDIISYLFFYLFMFIYLFYILQLKGKTKEQKKESLLITVPQKVDRLKEESTELV